MNRLHSTAAAFVATASSPVRSLTRWLRAVLALAVLVFNVPVHAEAPRAHVEGIARTIEENYFDESRATMIANDLRRAAAEGAFDALTHPRDLATALNDWLDPHDRHFNVVWSDSATQAPADSNDGPAPAALPPSRSNHGVRRVEVMPGNIGYIDLRSFAHFEFDADDQPARQAIDAALQMVAGVDALIIDLRDNGGGSPVMVGYLGSAFTPEGADIYNTFHSRRGTRSEAPLVSHHAPRLDVPLYLLISARTASAAEAFAYTMKNAKRATIVGEASMGAANPGGELEADHGFRVFVSFATPISPITGTNWEGTGVVPDIDANPDAALNIARATALQAVLKSAQSEPEVTDTRWALEGLRAETSPLAIPLAGYAGQYGVIDVVESDDRLLLHRERRPAWVLVPLGNDAFTVAGEPSRRIVFMRDDSGAVTALEIQLSNGQVTRYRR